MKMYKKVLADTYMGLLDSFSDFRNEVKDYNPEYVKDEMVSKDLLSKYHIDEIAGSGSDLDKILNLLQWLAKNVNHNGGMLKTYHGKIDAVSLLDHAYHKDVKNGLNCLYLSYVLSECLITLGIKARPISMMPMSPYDDDNHVVVMTYTNALKKWIMVDPTYGSYFLDEHQVILDLIEIREALSKRKIPKMNEAFFYNDLVGDDLVEVKEMYPLYIAKNSFAYYTFEKIEQGKINQSRRVDFCPLGYSVSKRYETKGETDKMGNIFNYLDIESLRK
jgi:hypothetical protein